MQVDHFCPYFYIGTVHFLLLLMFFKIVSHWKQELEDSSASLPIARPARSWLVEDLLLVDIPWRKLHELALFGMNVQIGSCSLLIRFEELVRPELQRMGGPFWKFSLQEDGNLRKSLDLM